MKYYVYKVYTSFSPQGLSRCKTLTGAAGAFCLNLSERVIQDKCPGGFSIESWVLIPAPAFTSCLNVLRLSLSSSVTLAA